MPKMTQDEILTLLTVVSLDREVTGAEIGEIVSGSSRGHSPSFYEYGRRYALPLVEAGVLVKPAPDRYLPTERGRIAAGLLMAKDPGLYVAFFDD